MRKTIFNILFITSLVFAGSLTFTNCGNPSHENHEEETVTEEESHEHDEADHEHESQETATEADETLAYACPMHQDVKGKEGDTCSRCNMALVKIEKENEQE